MAAVLNSKLQVTKVLWSQTWVKWKLENRLQSTICITNALLKLFNPFFLLFGPIYRTSIFNNAFWSCALQVERVGEKHGKNRFWKGRLILLNPWRASQGVTVCSSRGADGLGRWWRPGRVEGWRSTRHRVWRPSPWSWVLQDLFLSSFSRRISPFLRMEASIAVYLKHSHTTQHNIDKTREFRPKLHTKRAEMILCFTCYQFLAN